MNVNEAILCAIENDKNMYSDSLAMFAALHEVEDSDCTSEFESMFHERVYNEFAHMYRDKIESAFPWLSDEYFNVFVIMDALEDAYCNYLEEYVYNR